MKLHKDLKEFIELLNSEGVKYVIVGGYAVAFHGRPRFTGVIDFFVECSDDNSRRLESVFRKFGYSQADLTAADFSRPDRIIQLGVPPHRIDIVTSIDAVGFHKAWQSRVPYEMDTLPVFFIAKDLLLKNKRATGRSQDIADSETMTED